MAAAAARVLGRFERLTPDDRRAIIETTMERVRRGGPQASTEAGITHALLCTAVAFELRRWAAEIGVPAAEIAHELDRARRRAAALPGQERRVFAAVCALDDVAGEDEVGKVVLRAAVAYQIRWNTAHQHVSRAWRKICQGGQLASWCRDWREGHRFVCGPPSLALWEAGRAYMDACSGRGDHGGGEAFLAWAKAREAHSAWFNEWKKQSARAARRWREFAAILDGSTVRPDALRDALLRDAAALRLDAALVPARLQGQSWRDLLVATHRPPAAARDAWTSFLRQNGFGPEAEAAFREVERDAALADSACAELELAYRRLLEAAESGGGASTVARDTFRGLIDAVEPRIAEIAANDAIALFPEDDACEREVPPASVSGTSLPRANTRVSRSAGSSGA